jgi:hypothetical protein
VTVTTTTLGTLKSKSAPNVLGNQVWFQEDATNKLTVIPLEKPADAKPADPWPSTNPQGFTTGSMPQICDDGYVYFQSADNKLVVMQLDYPHLYRVVDAIGCLDTPEAPNDGYVYIRSGTSNSAGTATGKLARVDITPAKFGEVTYYDAFTKWTPAVYIRDTYQRAFFVDASTGKLNWIDLDKADNKATALDYTINQAPYMGENGKLYVVDQNNFGYEIDPITFVNRTIAGDVRSTPVTSEIGDDGNVYWQTEENKLLMAPRVETFKPTTELGSTNAQADVIGSGRVVYRATDNTLVLRDPG